MVKVETSDDDEDEDANEDVLGKREREREVDRSTTAADKVGAQTTLKWNKLLLQQVATDEHLNTFTVRQLMISEMKLDTSRFFYDRQKLKTTGCDILIKVEN